MPKPEAVKLSVQNTLEQVVFTNKFVSETGDNQITIQRSYLASGTYLAILQTESGLQTVKIVVE